MKNKSLHKLTIILILLLFSNILIAQNKEPFQMKNWELKQYAKDAKMKKRNVIALKYYNELYERKPNNPKYQYNVAFYSFQTQNYTRANEIFLDIYIQKKYKYLEALFYYAETCRILGENAKAKKNYEEFITITKNKHLKLRYFASNAIASINLIQDSSLLKNVQIHHLNTTINHPHLESSPIIINDSVFIYSSNNLDTIKIVENTYTQNTSKFYAAYKTDDKWTGSQAPPKPFFRIPEHCTANGAYSPDKTRFYFTVREESKRGYHVSRIFVTELIDDEWTEPEKLQNKINIPFYNSTQPTVGQTFDNNLEVIYFVSDRKGGLGGNDIWFTVYNKIHKTYTKPANAGGYINTPGDEITPFYDNKNKTMYFSSNGLPGFGGFDIFKTIGAISNWIPAQNIGTPINSSFNDIYFSKFQNKNKGFFISNRTEALDWGQENCCFDIFLFDSKNIDKIEITGQLIVPVVTINNEIEKIINNQEIIPDTTSIYLSNTIVSLNIQDTDSSYFSLFKDTTDQTGRFHFNVEKEQDFTMTINASGYSFSSCDFSTRAVNKDTLNISCLKAEPEAEKNIILKNILFEFNSSELTENSQKYIDSVIVPIMKYYQNIIVEIGAHTDYKGSADYNLELSQNRAESVVNYLTSVGINSNRLVAKGYGETKHLVPERNPDGSDNADARHLNRRVEFKIIGLTD